MNRVVCIGELLVDFFTVETDVSLSAAELFAKKAGVRQQMCVRQLLA